MMRVDNNRSLSLLFNDVHLVLNEASKEFEDFDYNFEFDSKAKRVKCVQFTFKSRRPYYVGVYPNYVKLFEYLDYMKSYAFSQFTYVRHSVNIVHRNGVKIYTLVLWY